MKRFGIISYNIYCNFTNYGSALQSWALQQTVDKLGAGKWQSVLVDYCPDILRDKDVRNPIRNMWDSDRESREMCRLSLPAIQKNADKFDTFFHNRFRRTKGSYTSDNFEEIIEKESLDGFICGSDTIFCIEEFSGFDEGYYANFPCMRNNAIAYAASFGDSHFTADSYMVLDKRLQNFQAIALRENMMLDYVKSHTSVPVKRVLDPTLLLPPENYECITAPKQEESPYLLLYVRRYNAQMEQYAERIAKENGWKIVEISLRAVNSDRHRMFYEAGVEEFLSLIKHAEFVVTNSYHGMIFSIQYQKNFYVFSREQCDTKIRELLQLVGLSDRLLTLYGPETPEPICYDEMMQRLIPIKKESLEFLTMELSSFK